MAKEVKNMLGKTKIAKGMGMVILAILLMQISGANAVANYVALSGPKEAPRTGFFVHVYYSGFVDGNYYYGVIQQDFSGTWVTITDFYMFEPVIGVWVPGSSAGDHYYRAIVYDGGPIYSNRIKVHLY